MRPASDRAAAILQGPHVKYECRAEVWYAGDLIHDGLPVTTGRLVTTADVIDTAEVSLSVPTDGGIDLADPLNPLGAYGQRLRLETVLTSMDGQEERIPLGWYRTTPSSASSAGGVMEVRARDLGLEIERARLVTPTQLTNPVSATPDAVPFSTDLMLAGLVTGILPIAVLDPLNDLEGVLHVFRDRKQAIVDLLQAAGGTAAVDVSGALVVRAVPDLSDPTSVLTFTDGVRGTVTDLRPEVNDSRGFNACIVQGVTAEGAPVFGGAFITDGPMAWPVQPGIVSAYGANPGFFFSPLLRTPLACRTAAQTILDGWILGANGSFTATAAPDPRLETNDVVDLVKAGTTYQGLVQHVDLPLTATTGEMTFSGVIL